MLLIIEWLSRISENSIHAVVTDPPYGVKEYDFDQLQKRVDGNGGIWRIPPLFDGHQRVVVDPFMGSGSTVAAGEAIGICCIGVERNLEYYEMSRTAIPKLITLETPKQQMNDLQLTLW